MCDLGETFTSNSGQGVAYLNLKIYEHKLSECVDQKWFQMACHKTLKHYYEVDESFDINSSFPQLSKCNENSQISQDIVDLMISKIQCINLNKYHFEWYYLANGCHSINAYLTLPLIKYLCPETDWYFCHTPYHSFVTNTKDSGHFTNLPSGMGIRSSIEGILVVDLTNPQIGMDLGYLSGNSKFTFYTSEELDNSNY